MYRKMKPLLKTDQNGFSLIEVLIAMLILAIGSLAITAMQASAIRGNSLGRDYTEATVVGMDQMEYLLTLPYTHADLEDTGGGNGEAGLDDGTGMAPVDPDRQIVNGDYTVFWNIAEDHFVEETKTVALYITWLDCGMTRTVRMRNVIPQLY